MSQDRIDDLYDRLTSRKFILTLLAVAFAIWNYHDGELTALQFQAAITASVMAYLGVEGAIDYQSNKAPESDVIADKVMQRIEAKVEHQISVLHEKNDRETAQSQVYVGG